MSLKTHMTKEYSSGENSPALQPVTRRRFLKGSALGVAGATVVAQFPLTLTGHAAPDTPIRIGLIGCGGRGTGAVLDALGAATKAKASVAVFTMTPALSPPTARP